MILSLLNFAQDEQESDVDQVYNGSGDADALQFSITTSLTLTSTVLFCGIKSFGGPRVHINLVIHSVHNYVRIEIGYLQITLSNIVAFGGST